MEEGFQDAGCASCAQQRFNSILDGGCGYRWTKQRHNIIQHNHTSYSMWAAGGCGYRGRKQQLNIIQHKETSSRSHQECATNTGWSCNLHYERFSARQVSRCSGSSRSELGKETQVRTRQRNVAQLLDKFPNKMFKSQLHEYYDLWALTQPLNSLGRITVCSLNNFSKVLTVNTFC
jgi:hypothetical protein